MHSRAAQKPETPEQAVRQANRKFYQAFAALSLEQMDEVWLHEDWIECVHPGWDLLLGWEEVRESWARIFAGTQRMKIEITSVWVRVEGGVAWVACTEQVTSSFEKGFDQALIQATNLFVLREVPEESPAARTGSVWKMVAHHASPLPAGQPPTLQ